MWLVAAETTPSVDGQTQIILAVIGLLSVVLVTALGGLFTLLTARANRTSPAQPPATQPQGDLQWRDYVVGELAVNRRRDDDNDERDDVQDRRHQDAEHRLDEHHQRLLRLERDRGWVHE